MDRAVIPQVSLSDGTSLPALGFGTYPMRGEEAVRATADAIDSGYRLVDSAVNYRNEADVGRAIAEAGAATDVVVTTKLPGRDHGSDKTMRSFEGSLARLGRVDLYLIHWPNPSRGRYVDAWRAMVELQRQGAVRSIGVSNFTEVHLRDVADATGVMPAVNQVEMHPYFPQVDLRANHAELGVLTESWSPLGDPKVFDEPAVADAAKVHGVTPAQVVLRWHVQLGSVPIPKSANPDRQRENADVFGFELTADELAEITALGKPHGRLFGGDPNHHEEM